MGSPVINLWRQAIPACGLGAWGRMETERGANRGEREDIDDD